MVFTLPIQFSTVNSICIHCQKRVSCFLASSSSFLFLLLRNSSTDSLLVCKHGQAIDLTCYSLSAWTVPHRQMSKHRGWILSNNSVWHNCHVKNYNPMFSIWFLYTFTIRITLFLQFGKWREAVPLTQNSGGNKGHLVQGSTRNIVNGSKEHKKLKAILLRKYPPPFWKPFPAHYRYLISKLG